MHAERFLQKAAKKTKIVMAVRVLSSSVGQSARAALAPLPFRIHREIFVLEILRDLPGLFHLDFFDRGIQLIVSFPALRGAAHVSGGMRQRDSRFGHADEFHRLLRRDREWQRFRIGKADVFARKDYDPSRVLVHLHVVISKSALFVGQRAIDQHFELLDCERLKSKNLRPRHECAIYVKERVVSSGADETKSPGLDVWQEHVLLCLVEMMDLI